MGMKEITTHGYEVKYDEDSRAGIKYLLEDLSWDEAKVFFDQAKYKGSAAFEDDEDRDYTLYYENGGFILARRGAKRGWFS